MAMPGYRVRLGSGSRGVDADRGESAAMIPGGVVGRAASYFRGARCERRQFHGSFRRDKVQRRANRVPSGPVRLTIACARVNIRKLLPHILTAETFPDSG